MKNGQMLNKLICCTIGILLLIGCTPGGSRLEKRIKELESAHPIEKGVSALFAGFVRDRLVVAGGCNFPDTPATQGGAKVFYDKAYFFRGYFPTEKWKSIPNLPVPTAYGASVETPEGLVCIGGMNADSSLTAVYRIESQEVGGPFTIRRLPSLPEPIDNASATRAGDCIYIAGGNSPSGGKGLYALRPDKDKAWKRLADYPGAQRIQPVLVAVGDTLFMAGGYSLSPTDSTCLLPTDLLQYDIATGQWESCGELPPDSEGGKRTMTGGVGIGANGRLLLTGGVNYSIFKSAIEGRAGADYLTHEPEWYKFNDDILIYDSRKRTWDIRPDIKGLARAGSVLLRRGHFMYMVCGETKPGVRTPLTTEYHLPSSLLYD